MRWRHLFQTDFSKTPFRKPVTLDSISGVEKKRTIVAGGIHHYELIFYPRLIQRFMQTTALGGGYKLVLAALENQRPADWRRSHK